MPVSFFIFLLILLFSTPLLLSSTPIPTHSRRALHQPFFPLSATPPAAQPPTLSLPKYPSSDNPQRFFPFYTTPPFTATSSSSSVPHTFPANIPTVISRPTSRHSSAKLVPEVLLPLIALALLALTIAFFSHGRRRQRHSADKPSRSDGQRLFPPDSVPSDGRKRSGGSGPSTGSEFLYLGTMVGSRRRAEEDPDEPPAAVPYCKLASPELRPLPPLSRQFRHNYGNAEGGFSSDEEFYSPRGSSAEKESPGGLVGGPASSSRRAFLAVAVEKCRSQSPTLSSPSYPSSNSASSPAPSSPVMSSSPIVSSPEQPTIKLPKSRSNSAGIRGSGFRSTPPLPPLPPLPLLQPLTPPPPKRKPTLPSPPSSSQEKDSDRNSRILDFSGQHLSSRIGDFSDNLFAGRRLQRPPPPPPPPPPAGYWEGGVQKPQASQPQPILGTPGPIGLKNSTAAVSPAELPENLGAVEKSEETPRPKLKPLHWDKVRASSDRAMVWDQLKSSSFKVNEEMIETLFVCNTTHTTAKETTKWQVLPSPNQENMVLDPKKSQNIAILLRALNVTKEEVCEALSEANTDSLGTELLETLLKMAPSKEEELKLKVHNDDSPFKLGPAETFLKAVLDIPFAFRRVDAMLYIANFDSEVNYLIKSFGTLEAACEELRSSRLFLKLLEAVLKTGNRMNVGTNRGGAQAFKLDTLLKLVDVKGTDGKTTLLHFVVQEIIRAEGFRLSATDPSSANAQASTPRDELELKKLGLKAVAGLGGELSNVKKAAAMDSSELSSYVSRFGGGIGKISEVLRLNDAERSKESGQRFHEAMSRFRKKAEDEIIRVQAQESVALTLVKEITEYFHGNSAKEEAHPFRIFMVVRDFLSILDQVCKEVGRIDGRSSVSSARQFPMPANLALLPLFPRFHALRPRSSDDEISSSSSSP